MRLIILISIIYNIILTGANTIIKPCKLTDDVCIEESINAAAQQLLDGIPSLGVESSDPLFVELAEGDLSILKFKFINSTVKGFKQCNVRKISINLESSSLKFRLECPKFEQTGKYEIDGRLIVLPIEGKGDYLISTGKFDFGVNAELKKVQGQDGKTHLRINTFELTFHAEDPFFFDFDNLFNGQKDLSDTVHKFAHENWREVVQFLQEPAIYPTFKKMFHNINQYLKTVPINDIILN